MRKDFMDVDFSEYVPDEVRRHFVQAFKGQYGYWFEFDGTVQFRDPGGGLLSFAYGSTIDECRRMMERSVV